MVARRSLLVIFLLFFIIGCGGLASVSWDSDIHNWVPEKRANFFMKTWLAEKANYDAMNAIENKSEALIKTLKVKRDILEKSRLPIRTYVSLVQAGGSPDADSEQLIIDLLRQMQRQYIYGG